MMKKGKIILIILMITTALVVFMVDKILPQDRSNKFASAPTGAESISKLDTSNWKTYVNEKWKYRLRYPEDWFVYEASEAVTYILGRGVETQPYVRDSSKMIRISVLTGMPYFPPVEIRIREITLSGVKGKELLLTDENGQSEWILIEKGGKVYHLIISLKDSRTVEIFDQMLKTFQFIE